MLKVIISKESFISVVDAALEATENVTDLVKAVVKPFNPAKAELIGKPLKDLTAEKLWEVTPEKDLTVGCKMVRNGDVVELEYNAEQIAKTIKIVGRFYSNLINPAMTLGLAALQTKVVVSQYHKEIIECVNESSTKVED